MFDLCSPPTKNSAFTPAEAPLSAPGSSPPRAEWKQLSPDEELFRSIQANSKGWKLDLFEHYVRIVTGLIRNSLGGRSDTQDLVADVFVTLFESAPNIRSSKTMRSYVVSVTLNTVRGEYKKRHRRHSMFSDSGDSEVEEIPGSDDPRARVALKELRLLLGELSHDERQVFVLHVVEGRPLGDVTKQLEMTRSTAKRRLKKASERVHRRARKTALLKDYMPAASNS